MPRRIDAAVREGICEALQSTAPHKPLQKIANEFGVSVSTVCNIGNAEKLLPRGWPPNPKPRLIHKAPNAAANDVLRASLPTRGEGTQTIGTPSVWDRPVF
jgi:hypothetical protein